MRSSVRSPARVTSPWARNGCADYSARRRGQYDRRGDLDAAPTFSIGTGGLTLVYAQGTAATTTSFEIPASRSILGIQIINPAGVTLAGGALTATSTAGGLLLSSGVLNTDSTNLLTLTGGAAGAVSGGSAATYVNGPFVRVLPSAASGTYTFPVGKSTFKMLELVSPTTTGAVTIQTKFLMPIQVIRRRRACWH